MNEQLVYIKWSKSKEVRMTMKNERRARLLEDEKRYRKTQN